MNLNNKNNKLNKVKLTYLFTNKPKDESKQNIRQQMKKKYKEEKN